MKDHTVFNVQQVAKKFSRNIRRSMFYGAIDVVKSTFSLDIHSDTLRPDEFWAVYDVSFRLQKGSSLGVIGANGSGKSTLLRLLNGIYQPDRGRIEIQGRIGALIALGAGFHPLMTGRENIYLNGTILGLSKRQIDKRFDEIVAFADIGEFLDAPVKTYSSGMYVRLGFAIAIHADPDILLVDEVLSVGDANFQKKCFDRLLHLRDAGTSLIFISHSMSAVERLCTECLLMKHGSQLYLGNTRECVQRYFHDLGQENLAHAAGPVATGVGDVILSDAWAYQENGDRSDPNIEFGRNIIIEFKYRFLRKESSKNQVRVGIRTWEGRDVQKLFFHEAAFLDGKVYSNEIIQPLKAEGTIQFRVENPRLFPQTFRVDIAIAPLDMEVHLGALANAAVFNIVHPPQGNVYFEYGNMSIAEFDYSVSVQ